LDADLEELWRRCREQRRTERPLLGSLESFRNLYEARRPHYMKALLRQETGGKTIEEIAAEVVQALGLDQDLDRDPSRIRGKRSEKQ
jgi:shikimate kinase